MRKLAGVHGFEPVSLGELIHQDVRVATGTAARKELLAALGATFPRFEIELC